MPPGNKADLPIISAKIHPTDHISIAFVNWCKDNINSGALYHLVATYSVITRFFSDGDADRLLAIPKSPEVVKSKLGNNERPNFVKEKQTMGQLQPIKPKYQKMVPQTS